MSALFSLPDLPLRLTLVIQTLCQLIAAHAGRDRAAAPITLLVWRYLNRLTKRFEALVRRVRAGEAAPRPPSPRADSAPRPRKPRLPEGFAWLIRLAPEAAQVGGQLRALLADPAFAALLAEAPQAGKILRPLCRMLGLRAEPGLPPVLFKPPALPPAPRLPTLDTSAAPVPDRPAPPAPVHEHRSQAGPLAAAPA